VGLDNVGLGGVEQFYNEKIIGEPGKLYLERDSEGKPYESFRDSFKARANCSSNIDQSIQYRAEQALATAVKQSRAKSGTAIVLEPQTGEILALANAPTFDPNNPGAAPPQARSNWALQKYV